MVHFNNSLSDSKLRTIYATNQPFISGIQSETPEAGVGIILIDISRVTGIESVWSRCSFSRVFPSHSSDLHYYRAIVNPRELFSRVRIVLNGMFSPLVP